MITKFLRPLLIYAMYSCSRKHCIMRNKAISINADAEMGRIMKIAICEDQAEERELLMQYCLHLGYENICSYSSGTELLNSPELTSFALVFLDIEMNDINGIDVKKQLEQNSPTTLIVFCTSHQEHIKDAFGRNVISFLSKPLTENDIADCLKQAAYFARDFYPIIIENDTTLACRDVLYLQAEHKYTIIYTENGLHYLSRKTLQGWIEELGQLGFCPISRSAVINLKYYKKLIDKNRNVLMQNGTIIPISRYRQKTLYKELDIFMLHRIRLE